MKKFTLLGVLLSTTISLSAQTYFQQDFNSSNKLESYLGGKTKPNNFDAISTVGNSSVEIFNNKLRITKRESSEQSRIGITRKTLFKGMSQTGANFMKYSMEVTVSGNTTDVKDGFAFFFVKDANSGAHAPGPNSGRHSYLAIDPRSKEGDFRVRVNGKSSQILSGTYTIISYINNSGASVSYKAPDNSMVTLGNDELDVWVIDKNGLAESLLTKVPARDPEGLVRNFKIAANLNFSATLDIDNILIAEEPLVK